MGVKKRELKVSLPCIASSYFVLFTVVGFILWLTPFVMIFDQGETSISSLAQQIFTANNHHLDLSVREQLTVASQMNSAHTYNFMKGVVYWSVDDPQQGVNFRELLRSAIVVNSQFQFVSMNYEYVEGAWGFCGWFEKDKFYYTNQTGSTFVFPAPDGNVTWTPLYSFYTNNTDSLWVTIPIDAYNTAVPSTSVPSLTGKAWTPVYVVEYEETGVDLYASNGEYFIVDGKKYIFEVDVNLKYISSLLKNGTNGSGTAFMIERKTGFLVGTSSSTLLYQRGTDGSLSLVEATACSDTVVSRASRWLLDKFNTYSQIETGSYKITIEKIDHFMVISNFVDDEGIDWVLVQVKPESYFLGTIRQARIPSIVVPVCVYLFVLLITALVTFVIVKNVFIVYQSSYNEESFPDELPVQIQQQNDS